MRSTLNILMDNCGSNYLLLALSIVNHIPNKAQPGLESLSAGVSMSIYLSITVVDKLQEPYWKAAEMQHDFVPAHKARGRGRQS